MVQLRYSGDYGRVEGKKVFMGVAQIMIDDLDLSNIVIGKFFVLLTLRPCVFRNIDLVLRKLLARLVQTVWDELFSQRPAWRGKG